MAKSLSAISVVCTIIKKVFLFLKARYKDGHFSFVNQAELSFLRRDMSIDEIEKVYMQKYVIMI